MNKPIYLGLSILDLNKTVMFEFWYDSVKPEYGEKANLWFMDTDSFIAQVRVEDMYKDINQDVEKRFGTSNFDMDRPFPVGKDNRVIGLMKDELGGQIMKKHVVLWPKTNSYLKDNNNEDNGKKAKGAKKCAMRRKLKFQDYNNCLKASQIESKVNYLENKEVNVDCLKEDQGKFI